MHFHESAYKDVYVSLTALVDWGASALSSSALSLLMTGCGNLESLFRISRCNFPSLLPKKRTDDSSQAGGDAFSNALNKGNRDC